MIKQYIVTEKEIDQLRERAKQLKRNALIARDAGDAETNREYYFRARGFDEALKMLGIVK